MAGGDEKNEKPEAKPETNLKANETKPKVDEKEKNDKKEEQKGFKFQEKAKDKSGLEGFMEFLWNPETKEFLGRTGMSWCK